MTGRRRIPLDAILVEGSTYSRSSLKRRLYEAGLKDRRCELCGQGEKWKGRRISLIIDHINGVRDDHRLENLRIICPNCAAGLETHCGRKNRIGIEPRSCLRCSVAFVPKYERQRYCSVYCGRRHNRTPGQKQPGARKVERPSYDSPSRSPRGSATSRLVVCTASPTMRSASGFGSTRASARSPRAGIQIRSGSRPGHGRIAAGSTRPPKARPAPRTMPSRARCGARRSSTSRGGGDRRP